MGNWSSLRGNTMPKTTSRENVRMDRIQFFQKMGERTEDQLKKVLWELYWRGKTEVRERIEALLAAAGGARAKPAKPELDGEWVLRDIQEFAALLRSGAYMGGTRDVSRQERTKWRVTFRTHMEEASALLKQGDLEHGVAVTELLVDLLCEMRGYDYVHSEDPVQATGIVVSDRVELLWRTIVAEQGFREFARLAPPQFIRWESAYGWTRTGFTRLAEKERSLAEVLASILVGPDAWVGFADAYLDALDHLPKAPRTRDETWLWNWAHQCEERCRNLADWHRRLHAYLRIGEGPDRLFRIATHPALAGPEADFFLARLAWEQGQAERSHALMSSCLKRLPGHTGFIAFAKEIGVQVPARP